MSDELLNNELDLDVEGHSKKSVSDEPSEDKDDDEVEAHVRQSQPRQSQPRQS